MSEQLFIQLPANPEQGLHWYHQKQQSVLESGHADISELSDLGQRFNHLDIIILIADHECLVTQVSLPTKQRRQQLKALPFALEEQIASDIEQVHFALGKAEANQPLPVVAIEQARMDYYFELINQAGLTPKAMLPSCALVTAPDDAIVIYQVGEQYLVNQQGNCFAANADDLALMLKLSLVELEQEQLPSMILYAEHNELPAFLTQFGLECELIQVPSTLGHLLASHQVDSVNLLQQAYELKTDWQQGWKLWRKAAMIAAGIILLQFVSMGFEVYQLQKTQDQLQAQILETYQQVAPGSRLIPGRAKAQMQQLLDRATGASSSDAAFMPMLEKVSQGMRSTSGVETTNLNYDSVRQELRMDLLVANLPTIDQLKEALSATGLQVEVGAASAQGNRYAGRLIIRSQS